MFYCVKMLPLLFMLTFFLNLPLTSCVVFCVSPWLIKNGMNNYNPEGKIRVLQTIETFTDMFLDSLIVVHHSLTGILICNDCNLQCANHCTAVQPLISDHLLRKFFSHFNNFSLLFIKTD